MIAIPRDDHFELVTQPDHARLAAQILALWRHPELLQNPRREELLLAVREHDNGWRETDAAPLVDPECGAPLDFRRFPRRARFEIWTRAVERLRPTPYAAALVANHAIEIHRDRNHESWTAFCDEMLSRRDEMLSRTGRQLTELTDDYSWLELADLLSLAGCGTLSGHQEARGYAFRAKDGVVEIDPFPLAGATTFEIPVRRIPIRRYQNSIELATRAAEARWQRRAVRISPPP